MSLHQRLREELIGKNEDDPDHNPRWQAYRNQLRYDQREKLPDAVASIEADLKGLLPKQRKHSYLCEFRNTECNCGASVHNQTLTVVYAAIEHYCRGRDGS